MSILFSIMIVALPYFWWAIPMSRWAEPIFKMRQSAGTPVTVIADSEPRQMLPRPYAADAVSLTPEKLEFSV